MPMQAPEDAVMPHGSYPREPLLYSTDPLAQGAEFFGDLARRAQLILAQALLTQNSSQNVENTWFKTRQQG